VNNLHIITLYK